MAYLLVVLRGEAFRSGAQHSRDTTKDRSSQWRVLESLKRHVLAPAAAQGWACTLLADVAAPQEHAETLRRRLYKEWHALDVRVTSKPEPTQLRSMAHSIQWAVARAPPSWAAALFVRADLLVKSPLPLPSPARPGCSIWVPFQTLDGHGVADTIQFVPFCRFVEFYGAVAKRAAKVRNVKDKDSGKWRANFLDHMHALCEWVPGIAYFTSKAYDANSAKDNNPLYKMVGRREQLAGAIEIMLEKKGRERPSNGLTRCKHGQAKNCSRRGQCHGQLIVRSLAQESESLGRLASTLDSAQGPKYIGVAS